jgi:prevent-host-death family protein
MKTITASEFKANCLKYVDQVAETGETLAITKNGRPMVELGPTKKNVPVENRVDSLFGLHRGQIRITGDIMSPLYVEQEGDK